MASVSEFPLKEFRDFLQQRGLSESSAHQVVLAIRRALRHLGPDRLSNQEELYLYRLSMPDATRRLFGYAWPKFREYAAFQGERLPELDRMPTIKLVHPLWADLTDLSIQLNVHRIESMRWADLAGFGPEAHEPARRVFEFIAGRAPAGVDWLIPRDRAADEPMPFWMMDAILRTNATEESRSVEQAAFALLETVTRRGISADHLKKIWTVVEREIGSAAGRRRIDRIEDLPLESEAKWSAEDQERLMSALGDMGAGAKTG
jgi:hypothetical protein